MRNALIHAVCYTDCNYGLGHLLRGDPGVLLDSFENINKSYLGGECVSVVDIWIAAWSVPAVNWHIT